MSCIPKVLSGFQGLSWLLRFVRLDLIYSVCACLPVLHQLVLLTHYLIATLENNTVFISHSKQMNLESTCACYYFNIHTYYNRIYGLYSERYTRKMPQSYSGSNRFFDPLHASIRHVYVFTFNMIVYK